MPGDNDPKSDLVNQELLLLLETYPNNWIGFFMIRFIILAVILCVTHTTYAQKQGIKGKVVWLEGNQMPGPGKNKEPSKMVQREIRFYEPVSLKDVKSVDGLYTSIPGKVVATVQTNSKGEFCVKLPPGEYSVFTVEENGLFANIFDEKQRINVVTVQKKLFSNITIEINYKAAF
jgi:hypothetical protein